MEAPNFWDDPVVSQKKMKEVITVVELDQFKVTLNAYREPLQEVRDSL